MITEEILYRIFTDVNECELKTAGCEETCENTVGGFRCSCPSGTRLSGDGVSCIGKSVDLGFFCFLVLTFGM